jgi:ammonium transporter, Amt family
MSFCSSARRLAFVFVFFASTSALALAQDQRPAINSSSRSPGVATPGVVGTSNAAYTPPSDIKQQVASAALAGHNAWMLTSAALVLLMTAPGLALFYGGLVRKKNVLGVMMQCFFLMGLNSVIWALWGYSLVFGGDPTSKDFNPWIGNGDYLCMRGVERTWNVDTAHADPTRPCSLGIRVPSTRSPG